MADRSVTSAALSVCTLPGPALLLSTIAVFTILHSVHIVSDNHSRDHWLANKTSHMPAQLFLAHG